MSAPLLFLLLFLSSSFHFLAGKPKYFFSEQAGVIDDWVAVLSNAIDFNNLQRGIAAPGSKLRAGSTTSAHSASSTNSSNPPPVPNPSDAMSLKKKDSSRWYLSTVEDKYEGTEEETQSPTEDAAAAMGDMGLVQTVPKPVSALPEIPVAAGKRPSLQAQGSFFKDEGDSEGEEIPELSPIEPPPTGKILSSVVIKDIIVNLQPPTAEDEVAQEQTTAGDQQQSAGGEDGDAGFDDLPPQIPESIRESIALEKAAFAAEVARHDVEEQPSSLTKEEEEETRPADGDGDGDTTQENQSKFTMDTVPPMPQRRPPAPKDAVPPRPALSAPSIRMISSEQHAVNSKPKPPAPQKPIRRDSELIPREPQPETEGQREEKELE